MEETTIDDILSGYDELIKVEEPKSEPEPVEEEDEPVEDFKPETAEGYDTNNYIEFNKFPKEKKNQYMKDARRFCKGALVEYYNWKGIDHRFKDHKTDVDIREVNELKRVKMYWAVKDKGFLNDVSRYSEMEYKNYIFNEMRNFISFMMIYYRFEFNKGKKYPDMKVNELQHLVFEEDDEKVLCIVLTDRMKTD